MFVLTMGKNGLKRLGALAVAGVALAGVVFAAGSFSARTAPPPPPPPRPARRRRPTRQNEDLEHREHPGIFQGLRMEVDLATATVDKVKIPKSGTRASRRSIPWLKESGMSLEKYKGQDRGEVAGAVPGRSSGDQKAYGVLLVYKGAAGGRLSCWRSPAAR